MKYIDIYIVEKKSYMKVQFIVYDWLSIKQNAHYEN